MNPVDLRFSLFVLSARSLIRCGGDGEIPGLWLLDLEVQVDCSLKS